jgi:hypothetical protein
MTRENMKMNVNELKEKIESLIFGSRLSLMVEYKTVHKQLEFKVLDLKYVRYILNNSNKAVYTSAYCPISKTKNSKCYAELESILNIVNSKSNPLKIEVLNIENLFRGKA